LGLHASAYPLSLASRSQEDCPPMSTLAETAPAEPAPGEAAQRLAALRAELDTLDDALHDTLMRRAEVVGRIAALRAKAGTPLRPGREAAILRRLLARHRGALPRHGVVRVWRELIAAMTELQRPLVVAVCGTGDAVALAREQFGALVALRQHPTPVQALGEVAAGTVAAAVLPVPADGEPLASAWWTALLHRGTDECRVHVVARLPFWAPRPEGAPCEQALVVSVAAPDPSGQDRTLLALDLSQDSNRARLGQALAGAGLEAGTVILRRDPDATWALVEVEGFVTEDDPRLTALHPRPVVVGAYAVPVGEAS
jgi:chorismate mutase/prephenate dehydratase